MTVRVYKFSDAGAPTLDGTAGSFAALLYACLVTGYGSLAGSGWARPYTTTNVAVFKQGAGSNGMYLRVDNTGSSNLPRLIAYEGMTGHSTGTNPFPTTAQVSGGLYIQTSNSTGATAKPWMVVADAKRFYVWIGASTDTTTGFAYGSGSPMMFFGDIISNRPGDAYHTMLIAGQSSSMTSLNQFGGKTSSSASSGHFIARANDQTALSTAYAKSFHDRETSMSFSGNGGIAYPDPVTGGLILSPYYALEPTGRLYRGVIPGLYAVIHPFVDSPPSGVSAGDTFSGSATGGLSGKSFILLSAYSNTTTCRMAIEISDTWE